MRMVRLCGDNDRVRLAFALGIFLGGFVARTYYEYYCVTYPPDTHWVAANQTSTLERERLVSALPSTNVSVAQSQTDQLQNTSITRSYISPEEEVGHKSVRGMQPRFAHPKNLLRQMSHTYRARCPTNATLQEMLTFASMQIPSSKDGKAEQEGIVFTTVTINKRTASHVEWVSNWYGQMQNVGVINPTVFGADNTGETCRIVQSAGM